MSNEEDPFAEDGDDDGFNPFSKEMFDKKEAAETTNDVATEQKQAAPKPVKSIEKKPTKKPSSKKQDSSSDGKPGPANPTGLPDWAVKPQLDNDKEEDHVEVDLNDDNTPDWAKKKAEPPREEPKEKKQTVKKQPVKSNYRPAQKDYAEDEPLLKNKDPAYRPANFPAFPKRCCWPFRPCFHHDFRGEIPRWGYSTTRFLYIIWYLTVFALFWNMVAMLAALDCGSDCVSVQEAGTAAILFIVLTPCSYYCWFHQLYTAMRKDSAMRFGCFFLMFFIQFLACCLFAVGLNSIGSAGILNSITATTKEKIIGFLMFVAAGFWILLAFLDFIAIQRVLLVFRTSGHKVEDIEDEFTAEAGRAGMKAAVASQRRN